MRRFLVFLMATLPLSAQSNAVTDRFVPAAFASQQMGGILGARMRVNLEGRLLHVDEKGILDCFRQRPGHQDWAGEHAGKFLDAAANTWLYTHDERLKTLMDRVAKELISTQLPDGYLGTYLDSKRWTSWDVWVHKYDLLGLLAYYQATGDAAALEASRKIGDLLVRTFGTGPGQRDIIASGTHVGMAATSVLEPMVLLYRQTGDRRYLLFCEYLIQAWEQPNGPKILSSLLSGHSVYQTANAKAYEMLSNLVGLLEMYRVTGKAEYLRAPQMAWNDIVAHRLYVDGTTSAAEHFHDDAELPADEMSNVGEGCVTVTFLQLTLQLFRLTGEVKYAEQLENTAYNAVLAAQDPVKGNICYFTPLNGKKGPTPGINCCVSSEPRGISMIPGLAWGTLADGVSVQFYVPGKVVLGDITLETATTYPLEGSVKLTLRPAAAKRFPLALRVPQWTKRYTAVVAGRSYDGVPGEWLKIDREWKPGDTVEIDMDMTARLLPGGPSNPHQVAIMRGPQLLALDSTVNPKLIDLPAAGPRVAELQLADAREKLPLRWTGTQAYSLDGVAGGKLKELLLVPFADAVNYRVWLLRP